MFGLPNLINMNYVKNTLTFFVSFLIIFSGGNVQSQTGADTVRLIKKDTITNKREEKNRNVMLNAENNSGPRNVNFGLPFAGDILILENDVPVVYSFYPTLPTSAWRMDNSLSKMGLMSFAEGALTFGKVGFAVQSSDREATSSFKGFASIYGNGFGSSRYDITVSGPVGKKGWGYMASLFQNYDRGNGINFMYTPWYDRTQMAKFAIQKRYAHGSVRILYKFIDSRPILGNYNPLTYLGDGKTKPINNFDLGKSSYVLRDGLVPYYDPYTGAPKIAKLSDDEYSQSLSHNIYLTGNHKFDNGWNLTYTGMFQSMSSPWVTNFPLSLAIDEPENYSANSYYTYSGTNKRYNGAVQTVVNDLMAKSDNSYWVSRAEVTKKIDRHDLRIGLTYQHYDTKYLSRRGTTLQTVEANPQLLDQYNLSGARQTNEVSLLPSYFGGYGFYLHNKYSKTALYASDDIDLTKWVTLNLGARIEHQNKLDERYADANGFFDKSTLLSNKFDNKWNKVGIAGTTIKLTGRLGLVGDLTYNSWYDSYMDYPFRSEIGSPIPDPATGKVQAIVPKDLKITVMNYGGGIYYNYGSLFSIVSKITRIKKENVQYNNANITDPATRQRFNFDPIFYNISTLGFSTDVVASPFKNFTIHYLLTLQKPEYENFKYGAFGVVYDYSGNTIPELSKMLMEIDPSYSVLKGALRFWLSLRYFGRQYANPTNAFYYNSRWENFGGLDYRMSRNVSFKLQMTNFLNQKGVKGAIQGADQVIDATPYIGRKIVAGAIRPQTIELTANFKF